MFFNAVGMFLIKFLHKTPRTRDRCDSQLDSEHPESSLLPEHKFQIRLCDSLEIHRPAKLSVRVCSVTSKNETVHISVKEVVPPVSMRVIHQTALVLCVVTDAFHRVTNQCHRRRDDSTQTPPQSAQSHIRSGLKQRCQPPHPAQY